MTDYSNWKNNDNIPLTAIRIDPLNPRLPENSSNLSQNDLINNLIDNYQVYEEIAKSISKKGYYPLKRIILVKIPEEKNLFYVIEGNRRVTALKALQNPDIVKNNYKNRFKNLSDAIDLTRLKSVPAVIAPSRESVLPILFAEHALNPTRNWSVIMKAEFYSQEVVSGKSIEDLSNECDVSISEIKTALRMHQMYNVACSLELEDEIRDFVMDKNKFPGTTLERLYSSKIAQEKLGFYFNEKNELIGTSDKEEFKTAFKKIIIDLYNGPDKNGFDSRSINSDIDKKKYFSAISSELPKKKGVFKYSEVVNDAPIKPISQNKPKKSPKKRSNRKPTGLIPSGVPFKLSGATNTKKIYDVLRILSIKSHPVPTAVLLRVLLDKVLRFQFKNRNIKSIQIKVDGEMVSKNIDNLTLKQMLEFICSRENPFKIDNGIIKTVKKYMNSTSTASLSALNNVVHNDTYTLNEEETRENWENLEAFLIKLLEE